VNLSMQRLTSASGSSFTGKQPGQVRAQFGHRMDEWQPLAPKLVAEVQYDHFTGDRFRHGAKFVVEAR
jgi:ATP-dependent DNA ligase